MLLLYWILQEGTDVEGVLWACGPNWNIMKEGSGRDTFHFHALEEEMATHSSVLAWRIPGTGGPGRLPSLGSHRLILHSSIKGFLK